MGSGRGMGRGRGSMEEENTGQTRPSRADGGSWMDIVAGLVHFLRPEGSAVSEGVGSAIDTSSQVAPPSAARLVEAQTAEPVPVRARLTAGKAASDVDSQVNAETGRAEVDQLQQQAAALNAEVDRLQRRIEELRAQEPPARHAWVEEKNCSGCGACVDECPEHAITLARRVALVEESRCTGCGRCVEVCPANAIALR